jgi:hypothetical protein
MGIDEVDPLSQRLHSAVNGGASIDTLTEKP